KIFPNMPRVCALTGKKSKMGYKVSVSNAKVKRKFHANIHKKKFYVPEKSIWITLKVSTNAIKTINRIGIYHYISKLKKMHLLKC
ncbi:MAG: 50S ribosomal protein L28, partial [Bacteroides sp.]